LGKYSALNITGVLATLMTIQGAIAADLIYSPRPIEEQDVGMTLPAVSGPNGKWELSLGPTSPGPLSFRAGASVSLPVGDRFGVQIDVAATSSSAGWLAGGVIHAFTRDPDSYLFGLASGVVRGPTGTLGVIGVEGELYLDDVSLEAWGGVAGINYDVLPDVAGVFLIADAAYYFTDDFRASLGVSHLLGVNGLHLGAEYQFGAFDMPLSFTADARYNSDGSYSLMAGLKGYFGGEQKSLKDRHRQDDPPNRTLGLFAASGSLLYAVPDDDACTPSFSSEPTISLDCFPDDPEAFCISEDYDDYNSSTGECYDY
jgi:hypothetical protein